MRLISLLICIALFPFAAAQAEVVIPLDHEGFNTARQAIETDLAEGQIYLEIPPRDQQQVLEALRHMGERMDGKQSLNDMSEADKLALFNDQELINQTLTRAAEDSRVICRRVIKTGSHRPTAKCKTVAEARRDREESQESLERMRQTVPFPREGGGGTGGS